MDKTQALKSNQGNFESIMALSGEAVADLKWWINSVEETSKPVKQRSLSHLLFSRPEVCLVATHW